LWPLFGKVVAEWAPSGKDRVVNARSRATTSFVGRSASLASDAHGLAAVAARASRDAKGAPAELLDGYLELLAEVSQTGRSLSAAELEGRRSVGAAAAGQGVPLRALVDIYLSATWLAWPRLPGVVAAEAKNALQRVGERIFRAADASIVAAAEGYEAAHRLAIRQEEAQRREFLDDLLGGRNDPSTLAERSQRFGLPMAADYFVAVAQISKSVDQLATTAHRIERDVLARLPSHEVLVTTKQGTLVCIASGDLAVMHEELARVLSDRLGVSDPGWRIAFGRSHRGLVGIRRSFDEAQAALQVAERLGLAQQRLKAMDLLVFEVLTRDVAAITDLVAAVLGSLDRSRLGARAYVETLYAYFNSGGVATVAARTLHVGVRTVTHRLARVRELTGYSVDDPLQRYTLETAVLGARLLRWPSTP
jgi:GGDEF-like domain/PucR C-terminal helix-turn-helix domain